MGSGVDASKHKSIFDHNPNSIMSGSYDRWLSTA